MSPSSPPGLGVLAFGDSITNGGGELQWGVALQSWALWVARALGIPFTSYAVDGATVADVVGLQIPAFERRTPDPGARYQLGCLYIGVNDVRSAGWDVVAYEAQFRRALRFVADRSERTVALTAPLDLGRPRTGTKVRELNAIVRAATRDDDALLVDLSDFKARNHVMADHVHPTAFGQIAIAERVLGVLAADGLCAVVRPAELITYETTRWSRLRSDATYVYRHAKVSAGAAWTRASLCLARPPRPG